MAGLQKYAAVISILSDAPTLARGPILKLGDACAGPRNVETYALTRRLIHLALNRLACRGATGQNLPEAALNEATTLAKLSPDAHAAREWADLAQTLASRHAHAVAVNLDPAQVILDTFIQTEATASRILNRR